MNKCEVLPKHNWLAGCHWLLVTRLAAPRHVHIVTTSQSVWFYFLFCFKFVWFGLALMIIYHFAVIQFSYYQICCFFSRFGLWWLYIVGVIQFNLLKLASPLEFRIAAVFIKMHQSFLSIIFLCKKKVSKIILQV